MVTIITIIMIILIITTTTTTDPISQPDSFFLLPSLRNALTFIQPLPMDGRKIVNIVIFPHWMAIIYLTADNLCAFKLLNIL